MIQIELPEEIRAPVRREAEEAGISIEEMVTRYVRERIEAQRQIAELRRRAERGKTVSLREVLDQVPDVPPMPGDELPEGWNES